MEIKKVGLYSAHSFKQPGGVQNHVLELYREFTRRGIAVKIIAPGKTRPKGIPKEDILMVGISKRIPANKSRADFSVSVRRRFRDRVRDENFDVMHFHNLGFGPLSLQLLRNSTALNILSVHAAADASHWARVPGAKMLLQDVYSPKFHGLVAVSPSALKTIETFGGFNNGPVDIISNGINLDTFRYAERQGDKFPKDRVNLLFVGRFEKRKGLMNLLRALKILVFDLDKKNLRLTIVGDGEKRRSAKRYIRANGLMPYAFMAGRLSDEIMPSCYQSADIFCAPSISGESFGITLLESMACGTPVVGFNNPGYAYAMQGHEELLRSNLLVTPGDDMALARKIAQLMDDHELYTSARAWGLEHCQQFAWPKIADRVLNFYKEAQNARRGI